MTAPYTADDEWGAARVTVQLWLDVNGNGTIEPGTDNLVRTTETDENGQYEFLGVPYGAYVVSVTDTDCVLADIDRSSFDSLLKYVPDFTKHVMNVLAGRLSSAYELIER